MSLEKIFGETERYDPSGINKKQFKIDEDGRRRAFFWITEGEVSFLRKVKDIREIDEIIDVAIKNSSGEFFELPCTLIQFDELVLNKIKKEEREKTINFLTFISFAIAVFYIWKVSIFSAILGTVFMIIALCLKFSKTATERVARKTSNGSYSEFRIEDITRLLLLRKINLGFSVLQLIIALILFFNY